VRGEYGAGREVGSGFIALWGVRPYLFTNIRAASLKQPEFTLLDGSPVSLVSAEVAIGSDIVRFTLKDPPEDFLECAVDVEKNAAIGDNVFVPGNSGGGVVTSLGGRLRGIGPDRIEVTAELLPGRSGSPIVHASTGRVIGVASDGPPSYAEMAKTGGAARGFGSRLDGARNWEPVNWAELRAEAQQMEKISTLTKDIYGIYSALRNLQTPQFATETLRQPAEERLRTMKATSQRPAKADRLEATRSFLGRLRLMTSADISSVERSVRSSYFREELRRERETRERLIKNFDEQSEQLAAAVQGR